MLTLLAYTAAPQPEPVYNQNTPYVTLKRILAYVLYGPSAKTGLVTKGGLKLSGYKNDNLCHVVTAKAVQKYFHSKPKLGIVLLSNKKGSNEVSHSYLVENADSPATHRLADSFTPTKEETELLEQHHLNKISTFVKPGSSIKHDYIEYGYPEDSHTYTVVRSGFTEGKPKYTVDSKYIIGSYSVRELLDLYSDDLYRANVNLN